MRWLGAVEVASWAPSRAGPPPPREPVADREQIVLPAEEPGAAGPGATRLRVVVSQSREVSLELEDKIAVPAPETETSAWPRLVGRARAT